MLAKNLNDEANIEYSIANILNYNMFGIPNVGAHLCGWYDTDLNLEKCVNSF